MSSDDNQFDFTRTHHIGALSEELLSPRATDGVKESFLSIFGFYSAYMAITETFINQKKDWQLKNDPMNEYFWNSYGYRDFEYSGPVDLIAAGCSQTVGQGVPVDARWSNQLAQKLGYSVATTAVAGWSTQAAINAVMWYIQVFGKPKAVALLLPDFFRYDILINTTAMDDRWISLKDRNMPTRRTSERSGAARDLPKLSKRPHKSSEIISSEFSYFISGQILRFFIEYCKEAGISLVWGTWDRSVHEVVDYASNLKLDKNLEVQTPKLDMSNYVNIEYFHNHNVLQDLSVKLQELKCHSDLKKKYGDYFDSGTDTDRHMGVHLHAHIADKFYEKLTKATGLSSAG